MCGWEAGLGICDAEAEILGRGGGRGELSSGEVEAVQGRCWGEGGKERGEEDAGSGAYVRDMEVWGGEEAV